MHPIASNGPVALLLCIAREDVYKRQVYKVVEVDAQTGKTRPLIAEQTKTFFYYDDLGPGLSAGRKYRHDVNDGKEIIWASEREDVYKRQVLISSTHPA